MATGEGTAGRKTGTINAFDVDDTILVKHRCDSQLFSALSQYYNPRHHRFEFPHYEFESVQSIFEAHGNRPVIVDDVRPFCVVTTSRSSGSVRRWLTAMFASHMYYDPYPVENRHEFGEWQARCEATSDVVFERTMGDTVVQGMANHQAVERATNGDAVPLVETDIDLSQVLK